MSGQYDQVAEGWKTGKLCGENWRVLEIRGGEVYFILANLDKTTKSDLEKHLKMVLTGLNIKL